MQLGTEQRPEIPSSCFILKHQYSTQNPAREKRAVPPLNNAHGLCLFSLLPQRQGHRLHWDGHMTLESERREHKMELLGPPTFKACVLLVCFGLSFKLSL